MLPANVSCPCIELPGQEKGWPVVVVEMLRHEFLKRSQQNNAKIC
jgi:hypothetical protein